MNHSSQAVPSLSEVIRKVRLGVVKILSEQIHPSGSGFVIDSAGHILTNAHVVGDAPEVDVIFHDGSSYIGKVENKGSKQDLACVRLYLYEEVPLFPLNIGNSNAVNVGDEIYAFGYPLALVLEGSPTVSRGIIKAHQYGSMRTDATTNLLNSGGPLCDAFGNAIGVNTWGYDQKKGGKTSEVLIFGMPNSYDPTKDGEIIDSFHAAIPINEVKIWAGFLNLTSEALQISNLPASIEVDGKLITHSILGESFNIGLSSEWLLQPTSNGDAAIFQSGNCTFSLALEVTNLSLKAFARIQRESLETELRLSAQCEVDQISEICRPNERSFSFTYRGDKQGHSWMVKGRKVICRFKPAMRDNQALIVDFRVAGDDWQSEEWPKLVVDTLMSRLDIGKL